MENFPLYDVKLHQQLIKSPFTPEMGSPLYWDGYDIAVSQFCQEEEWATWMAIKQWDSMLGGWGYSAKLEWSYALYPDSCPSRQPPARPASKVGPWGDSFHSGGLTHVPKIYLHCGKPDSHYASNCDATGIARHPENCLLITCKG